jgi:ketosteroid isomerase-like protein
MSEENVAIARRLVEAINQDALPRDLLTPDCEIKNATTAVTEATYHGYEGALKWRSEFFDVVEDARFEIEEILATGPDFVAIANRIVGTGSSSGVPVELRWASVIWVREGKIARAVGFNSRRAALEAVAG